MSKILRRLAASSLALLLLLLVFLPTPLFAQEEGPASTHDPISQGIVAVVIVLLFVFLAMEAAHRVLVAMASAAFLWAVTYFSPFKLISFENAARAVDMNVLLLLAAFSKLMSLKGLK